MKRALERVIPGVLHHPAGKEAKHHPGYDFTFVAGEKQLPVAPRCEELSLQLLFPNDRPVPATRPVDVNGMIGRYVVTGFGKIDRNPVFYRPPDIISSGLRKLAKESIWTQRQVQYDHASVWSLSKAGVNQPRHIGPQKQIDKLCGSRFLKKARNQIAHCTKSVGVSREGNLRAVG